MSTREVRKLSPQHTAGPPHGLGIAISTQLRSPSPHQPGHQGFRWTLCTSPACCQPSLESACVGVGVTRGLFPWRHPLTPPVPCPHLPWKFHLQATLLIGVARSADDRLTQAGWPVLERGTTPPCSTRSAGRTTHSSVSGLPHTSLRVMQAAGLPDTSPHSMNAWVSSHKASLSSQFYLSFKENSTPMGMNYLLFPRRVYHAHFLLWLPGSSESSFVLNISISSSH